MTPPKDPWEAVRAALEHERIVAGAAEEELQSPQQALMPLYAMGQNVITQLRLRAESQE